MKYSTYYPFFRKLANPLRIAIISSLNKKEKTVNALCKELKTEQSKVSHSLKELAGCFIVNVKKKGKNRIYSLNPTILPILKLIEKHSKQCCKCCAYCK
ncbi:transcriptional regulator [Candidatus Pacearchaeota archaeon CG06_land_8_20_14_3_00_35_12]|nr:MAG: transcriptional regulator [Candidatus Pacearchaeota archaeon CG06_land_8_20_14_3_00_35_12]